MAHIVCKEGENTKAFAVIPREQVINNAVAFVGARHALPPQQNKGGSSTSAKATEDKKTRPYETNDNFETYFFKANLALSVKAKAGSFLISTFVIG